MSKIVEIERKKPDRSLTWSPEPIFECSQSNFFFIRRISENDLVSQILCFYLFTGHTGFHLYSHLIITPEKETVSVYDRKSPRILSCYQFFTEVSERIDTIFGLLIMTKTRFLNTCTQKRTLKIESRTWGVKIDDVVSLFEGDKSRKNWEPQTEMKSERPNVI